jgi:uncharacterized membrane protein YdjX (TVP38/TMEM64 family)
VSRPTFSVALFPGSEYGLFLFYGDRRKNAWRRRGQCMMERFPGFLKKYGIIIAILAGAVTWGIVSYLQGGTVHKMFSLEAEEVAAFIRSMGVFSYLVFLLIVVLEVVLAPIPPLLLYTVAGILYSSLGGGLLVLAGNLVGATIDFFIARKFGAERLQKAINPALKKKFDRFFGKYGALAVFILRVNPLTTSDLVSYISGFTNMRYIHFIAATALGLAPLVFLQTYLGGEIFRRSSILIGVAFIFGILFLLLFIYLIILTLIGNRQKKD